MHVVLHSVGKGAEEAETLLVVVGAAVDVSAGAIVVAAGAFVVAAGGAGAPVVPAVVPGVVALPAPTVLSPRLRRQLPADASPPSGCSDEEEESPTTPTSTTSTTATTAKKEAAFLPPGRTPRLGRRWEAAAEDNIV